MNEVRELAKTFRELGDLYEELANIDENEELDSQQKEEKLESLVGKITIKALIIQKLNKKEEN